MAYFDATVGKCLLYDYDESEQSSDEEEESTDQKLRS
jgi:hypothetical protein